MPKAEFYVQVTPVFKKEYNSSVVKTGEVTGVVIGALTKNYPTDPSGMVIRFEVEIDSDMFVPVVKAEVRRVSLEDTAGRLQATIKQLEA